VFVCPRVVNPSTGLGGAGGATFFCSYVRPSVPPFCDRPICLLCIHYPLPLYVIVPSSVLCMLHLLAVYVLECTYVRTGLGGAGESHGKALGPCHAWRRPSLRTSTSSVLHTSSGICTGMYVPTGIGGAGGSHGKALGRVT